MVPWKRDALQCWCLAENPLEKGSMEFLPLEISVPLLKGVIMVPVKNETVFDHIVGPFSSLLCSPVLKAEKSK